MNLIVTVRFEMKAQQRRSLDSIDRAWYKERLRGPLLTGLDAANAQLTAERKKLRLKLVSTEIAE